MFDEMIVVVLLEELVLDDPFFLFKFGQYSTSLCIVKLFDLFPESPINTTIYVLRDLISLLQGISTVTLPSVKLKPSASGSTVITIREEV